MQGFACVRDVGRSFLLTDLLLCLLQAVVTSARGVPLDVTTTKRPYAQPTTNGIAMPCGGLHCAWAAALITVAVSGADARPRPMSAATPSCWLQTCWIFSHSTKTGEAINTSSSQCSCHGTKAGFRGARVGGSDPEALQQTGQKDHGPLPWAATASGCSLGKNKGAGLCAGCRLPAAAATVSSP